MKNFEQKLVLLLADPQLSDTQFRDAARFLTGHRLHRAISAADELRRHMRHLFKNSSGDQIDDEVYDRVKEAVITHAKLSPSEALRALASELELKERFPAKYSLRKGLVRLLKSTDASALLSAAERVRQRLVGAPNEHGWPLMGGAAPGSTDGKL